MREYYDGTASVAELYFSNANNESATRSDEEFVITHPNSQFAAVAPLAASEFKFFFIKTVYICGFNKDTVMCELPSPPAKSYVNVHFPVTRSFSGTQVLENERFAGKWTFQKAARGLHKNSLRVEEGL